MHSNNIGMEAKFPFSCIDLLLLKYQLVCWGSCSSVISSVHVVLHSCGKLRVRLERLG